MGMLTVEDEQRLEEYYNRFGGYWRFPDMLDYCGLVNPYFNHSALIREMQDFFPELISRYPSGMEVNAELASSCWGIKQEYVVVGNGASELIKAVTESLEGRFGVVRPTFEEYPNRLAPEQVVTFVPQKEMFRYDADDLIEFFGRQKVDTLLIINPDNPTGNFIPVEGLHKLAGWCEESGIGLILDESFVDFSVGCEQNSFLRDEILEKYPHMCVIKSMSKSYGIPGIRLGILCSANTKLIAELKKQVSIWNINSLAEYFMQVMPKYRADYYMACNQFVREREDFETELKKIPFFRVMPSQANYFFLEVLPPFKPKELCVELLRDFNILASACLLKKGITPNRYMRIAVRDHADNRKFIAACGRIFAGR